MTHSIHPPGRTIGVFVGIFGQYQDTICSGISQVAKAHNINVIFFAGAALKDAIGFRKHWNTIYDLARPSNIDGLIVFTAAIQEYVTPDELKQFFANYATIPTISINQKLDNMPSVTLNSTSGVSEMMRHLIEDHGYRRIAFIRGPEGYEAAEDRYSAYQDGLKKYGIPFDPDLVVPGNFLPESGVEAVRLLLDERKKGFEAILASNDGMAFGAWTALDERGIVVPADMALAGFDDVPKAQSFSIPLTTVSTSLVEHGRLAAQMIIDSLETGTKPQNVVIDTVLVVRESCGCLPRNASASITPCTDVDTPKSLLDLQRHNTTASIQNLICPVLVTITPESVEALVGAFYAGLQGDPDSQFLSQFSRLLQNSSAKLTRSQLEEGVISRWVEALSILQASVQVQHSGQSDYADVVITWLNQAQMWVIQTIERSHIELLDKAETDLHIQSEMVRDINTASEIVQICDVLAQNLPHLGIQTSAVVLYEGEILPPPSARLIMACYDGKRIELGARDHLFLTDEIVPVDILPRDKSPLLALLPLVTRDVHFGYMLMEIIPGHWSLYNTYLALAEQISAALYGVRLQQELKQVNEYLQSQTFALAATNIQLEKARQDAEKADTVKSAFLASMSHELRTPLNAIINFSKFLAKGIPGPVNEEQMQLIGSIADSGQHLLNLINDVLDMSKIESGSLKLYVENGIDLHQIIEAALRYTRPLLADKPVEVQLDLSPTLPIITGDRKRLLQILLNVLSNACKFTEEGTVRIRTQHKEDVLHISVEDTGAGIAPEDAEHVFTAFKQTDSGLRQGGGGTGLGMPICQKLVEAHGGHIWFESQVGTGTTFYVELPLKTELEAERSKQHA